MNRAGRKKKDMEKVKKMKIRKIDKDKKQYLELLVNLLEERLVK